MKLNRLAAALFSASVLLTGVGNVQANVIDLTASKDLFGVGNGAVFSNPTNLTNVGSGVIDPFVRIQRTGPGSGSESGFNTDAPVSLDTKPGPTFTHSIKTPACAATPSAWNPCAAGGNAGRRCDSPPRAAGSYRASAALLQP